MAGTAIVIGAGIIGAGIALRLAQTGWQVTVVSAGAPAATSASFGWINASFYHDDHHHLLRAEGISAWHRLTSEVDLDVAWIGCLCWDMGPEDMACTHDQLIALDYPVQRMSRAQIAATLPALKDVPDHALYFPTEGAAASGDVPQRLLDAAQSLGAKHLRQLQITNIQQADDGRRIVETSLGNLVADQVVIAAGTGTQALAALCGANVPLLHRPAYILRTAPVTPMLSHIIASPIGEIRQEASGRLLMPTTVGHQGDDADTLVQTPDDAADQAMIRLRGLLAGLDDTDWDEVSYAERPVPQDGLPVVGPIGDGVYVACLHSGITLGPIVAELAAADMSGHLTNAQAAALAPYRPDRFQTPA